MIFSQQCTLLFGSWAHSNDSIKYALYSKNLSLIDFYDNQEWQLDLVSLILYASKFWMTMVLYTVYKMRRRH